MRAGESSPITVTAAVICSLRTKRIPFAGGVRNSRGTFRVLISGAARDDSKERANDADFSVAVFEREAAETEQRRRKFAGAIKRKIAARIITRPFD